MGKTKVGQTGTNWEGMGGLYLCRCFQVALFSGLPQILPSGAAQPDGAAGHSAGGAAPGLCPRLAGGKTLPADTEGAGTQRYGAAVRSVFLLLLFFFAFSPSAKQAGHLIQSLLQTLQLTEAIKSGRRWRMTKAKRGWKPSSSSSRPVRGSFQLQLLNQCDLILVPHQNGFENPSVFCQSAEVTWQKRSTRRCWRRRTKLRLRFRLATGDTSRGKASKENGWALLQSRPKYYRLKDFRDFPFFCLQGGDSERKRRERVKDRC